MFKNNFKIAWRNLAKEKIYSSIKIGGFALGIAACLLIALFIVDELSYDRYIPNGNRIYRVVRDVNESGEHFAGTSFAAPFAKALKDEFPEVEQVGRLNQLEYFGAGSNELRRADKTINTYEEGFSYADQGFLDMLQIPLVHGNRAHLLDEPGTIVISKRKADKYFSKENPIGKTLIINNNVSKPYRITGVMDLPTHSHFQSDFLLTLEGGFYPGEQTNWRSESYYTYVMLRPGTDVARLENKFSLITKKYMIPSRIQDGMVDTEKLAEKIRYQLQPVNDIYLKSAGIGDDLIHGDIRFVWLFGIIAGIILVIASINFINLSTAKSENRAKEVGLRKTVGSNKINLVVQFLTESVLYSVFAFGIGIILTILLLPYFNLLSAKSLEIPWAAWWWLLPSLAISSIIIGTLSGFYPSFYLSSFQPINVLKKSLGKDSKRSSLRSTLVVFQFTVSIILIIGTFIIYRQFGYILNKKLGFEKEQVLLLHGSKTMGNQVNTFKNELQKLPGVKSVSISDYLPIEGTKRDGMTFWNEGKLNIDPPIGVQMWEVDPDYINTMGMKIIKGRNFSFNMPTDYSNAIIINQTMAKEFGFTNPIGKRIQHRWHAYEIIGVVKDFNYESMKEEIGGLCLVLGHSPNIVAVKVNTSDMNNIINSITGVWNRFSPDQPIRYTFLDESFAKMYSSIQRTGKIFSTFAMLAIIIACLGLFALSSFMIMQRTKEIGIRKVLGASLSGIFGLLSGEFIKLILLANIIAWPVAYYFMNKWLEDFAYRIDISWWMFVLSGGIALLIALATVSYQAIKAAIANPVESLRYE
jgi:putative ABC transport system permease protein